MGPTAALQNLLRKWVQICFPYLGPVMSVTTRQMSKIEDSANSDSHSDSDRGDASVEDRVTKHMLELLKLQIEPEKLKLSQVQNACRRYGSRREQGNTQTNCKQS